MAKLHQTPAGPAWADYTPEEIAALSEPALAACTLGIVACERLALAARPRRSRSRAAVRSQTSSMRTALAVIRALAKPNLP